MRNSFNLHSPLCFNQFPFQRPNSCTTRLTTSPQGLLHCLQALQDVPLAKNPPGPCTTSLQANRMPWCLPAMVVLLPYISPSMLNLQPISLHPTEQTMTKLLLLPCHTPHTCVHTATTPHPILPHMTPSAPPHIITQRHNQIEMLLHSQSFTRLSGVSPKACMPNMLCALGQLLLCKPGG